MGRADDSRAAGPDVLTRRAALRRAAATACSAAAALAGSAFLPSRACAFVTAVPDWVVWREVAVAADLDADGADELVVLEDRRAVATDGAAVLLETPEEWSVSDVLVGDVDGDGLPEVTLVVWKRGSYGDARPFWVEEDDEGYSQHIFIYRWRDGLLHPVWMSSELPVEGASVSLVDGRTFLIVGTDGRITLWEWQGWGLALVDRDPEPGCVLARAELLAFGDNIAHANIYEGAYDPSSCSYDFSPLFAHIREQVSAVDLALVVQETPLVKNAALRSSYPVFATPASMADALAQAGFGAVLSATNHANDQGERGLEDTFSYWEERYPAVKVVGMRRATDRRRGPCPALFDANGIRLAVFDCTYGLNGRDLSEDSAFRIDLVEDDADEKALLAAVMRAGSEADIVVCFLHIGEEYDPEPTERQTALARQLVEAGAAAVVCSHTHVLGPYGTLRAASGAEGAVFWGLGNLVSGQTDPACALGGSARLVLEKRVGADGAAETRIASHALEPTVCHLGQDGSVAAYFLEDYTDALAADHLACSPDGPLTVGDLRDLVPEPSVWDYSAAGAPAV